MGLLCNCPLGDSLPDVTLYDCPDSFGQIQKVMFQRLESSTGVKNSFTASDILTLSAWTAKIEADDGTKIVPSPYITNPATEVGEARTYGGGNETLGGIELTIGREPTTFTGTLLQESQITVKALKEMQCENSLGVFLVDANGSIGAIADDPESPSAYTPIPICSLFIGDKNLGGLEEPDSNAIQWSFYPNWSDNLVRVTPTEFNALTDLRKAS